MSVSQFLAPDLDDYIDPTVKHNDIQASLETDRQADIPPPQSVTLHPHYYTSPTILQFFPFFLSAFVKLVHISAVTMG